MIIEVYGMKSICFVCEGNICRSPIAEFLMRHLLEQANMDKDYIVFSRGLVSDTRGEDTYSLSKEQLRKHGIPFSVHSAQKINRAEYDDSDYVIVMDEYNIVLLKRLFFLRGPVKAKKLLSFTGENKDIQDPYYTRNFDVAYDAIEKGCHAFLDYLKKND